MKKKVAIRTVMCSNGGFHDRLWTESARGGRHDDKPGQHQETQRQLQRQTQRIAQRQPRLVIPQEQSRSDRQSLWYTQR